MNGGPFCCVGEKKRAAVGSISMWGHESKTSTDGRLKRSAVPNIRISPATLYLSLNSLTHYLFLSRQPSLISLHLRQSEQTQVMATFKVNRVESSPIEGQKPGTSGLRKKVKVFTQPHYLHNFVQSTFNALSAEKVKGSTLVVSGDGRYFSKDAIQIIIKMAAANGVRRVWVGLNGLMATPAVSAIVRERVGADGSKANGAFILTASHNPGGPNEDFGIKYNMGNGGPAPEGITDKIFENTKTIKEYFIAEGLPDVDISAIGISNFSGPDGQFDIDVFDSASDYVKLLNYDALSGVAGAYAKRIFVEELGAKESSLLNCVPKEDFGGGHPDPNLTYAKELVARMGLGKNPDSNPPEFGAAADGDADRNMILGKRFFVTPSDSVAIIAANAVQAIPYFSSGLKGVARSMPTSAALDVVAKHLNLKFFEVPTGWKFFGNLMDAGLCSVCGEESFGTGSDHIREKDGIWAVLAWLSILAFKNKDSLNGGKLVTVEDIVKQHWATFGRHYYTRYDYENVDAGAAKELMAHLVKLQSSLGEGIRSDVANVANADEFEYKDPVDGSVSKNQGIRYLFEDGSRLVFRLSGTGSEGATIRLYIEQYEKDSSKTGRDSQEALGPLVEVALKLSKMQEFTGRSAPTVIT
ncbi:Alpha-D-phosphohexomutase, alpha/beta/alpha domain I [Cynara cardunculus var. scolymus]|uniref:phosphoglucomutase (alpha-D-glucose-1,6-bisphosphate-dependent) n=1 Tax=Cynara cardunculus var. scolymus TaxID=59895 RepID=A0A124SDQ3_CYNCS|nr:Alpha-D-phosphohexomutase, alpha/beta/alpha domain I [Cynara cardunculus var. scolymus]